MPFDERRNDPRRALGRARGWLVALVLVLVVSWASPALAAKMHHHDLASLALMSEAIVLARRTSTRVAGYETLVTHEIVEVYEGPLEVGAAIEVPCDGYRTTSRWSGSGEEWRADDEVVLFLHRSRRRRPDPVEWRLVSSGLRIFEDGEVNRFEQHDNPGPYVPVPQGRDPFDVMGDPRGGPAVTRSVFEEDLRRAMERAAAVEDALAQRGTPEGTRRLLDAVGPPPWTDGEHPVLRGREDHWEDHIAITVLEALAEHGDLEAALDGIARVRGGVTLFRLRHPFGERQLLDVARDRAQPVTRRVAALQLLGRHGFPVSTAQTFAGAMALWSDPDPWVRRAAVEVRSRSEDVTPRIETAVVEAFRMEQTPRVRYALARHAEELGILGRLGTPAIKTWPVVWAERRNRVVDIAWFDPTLQHVSALEVELQDADAPPRRVSMDPKAIPRWGSMSSGGTSLFIGLEHELHTGTAMTAWVTLEDASGVEEEHRLPLRAYGVAPEGAAWGSASSGVSAVPQEVEAAPPTVPPIPPHRGRGCTIDPEQGGRRWLAGLMLALVVLGALRRHPGGSVGGTHSPENASPPA